MDTNSSQYGSDLWMPRTVAVLIALAAAGCVSYWWYYGPHMDAVKAEHLSVANNEYEMRNFQAALQNYNIVADIAGNKSPQEALVAQQSLASTMFKTYDPQKESQAIAMLKKVIDDAKPYPVIQASALHQLKTFNCVSGRDPAVFNQIYSGEYAKYLNEANKARTVRDLLLQSFSVSPEARTAGEIAANYGIELVESTTLTAAERKTYRANVIQWIAVADTLLKEEKLPIRQQIIYYSWEGYAYGSLAIDDPTTYGPKFEQAFQKSISIPVNAGLTVATEPGQIEQFSQFYYAYFLGRIYGASRAADVKLHADALMTLVKSDPEPQLNEFLAGVRVESKQSASLIGVVYALSIYPYAKEIIKYEPAFRDFLHQYNYTLL